MHRFFTLCLLILSVTLASTARADWPMWRGDAARTGATEAVIPERLALLWHRSLGQPEPAFVHQFRMCADAAYAPVAADGLLFVPSNLRDEVVALELRTGKTVWRYVAEGPVRYAPVAGNGRLYVGSDDGSVVCLEAASGMLVWKTRGVPARLPNSKLLVNGRLCSRWPVRGAPVLWRDKLFFGAGIWPEEGAYVTAVDAKTGAVLWRTDALSIQKGGMNDHNKLYDLGLPPLGYLAVINGKLAVPSGRSLAIFLDPETGEAEPYNCYYTKHNQPRGTWWLCGNSNYWIQAGSVLSTTPIDLGTLPAEEMDLETFAAYAGKSPKETLRLLQRFNTANNKRKKGKASRVFSGLNRLQIIERDGKTIVKAALRSQKASGAFTPSQPQPNELYNYKNRPLLNADYFKLHNEVHYTEPVLSGKFLYNSILDDETKYLVGRGETYVRYPPFDRIVARDMSKPRWTLDLNTYSITRRLEFPVVWELKTPHKVIIAAGDRVVAGIPGEVIVVKPPVKPDAKPAIVFKAEVDGAPVNALLSRGRLVVATDTGKLYCFGTGTATEQPDQPVQKAAFHGKALYPSCPDGYALVLSWGTGKLPERLLSDRRHQVVVLEPDGARAERARRSLAERGLYGRRIQIVTADRGELLLAKYWANLVVAEDLAAFSASLPEVCALALDSVRPFTGILRIPAADRAAAVMEKAAAARPEFARHAAGANVEFRRTTPPKGYDEWTHETAGPANTFASRDTLVRSPLGLLWFSGTVDRFYTPEFHFQHFRTAYPLVSHGRMFLIGGKYLNAVDVYTGNFLWQIEMPMTQRVQWRYQDSRVYSRPYERNYVTTPDTLYIIYEQEIHRVATTDGSKRGVLSIPKELAGADDAAIWTEVRLAGDCLYCVVKDTLACLDRKTGNVLWKRQSSLDGTAYAIGDGALYGVDYAAPPDVYKGETGPRKESLLFRLDPETGKQAWSTSLEHATVPDQSPKQKRAWLLPITPGVICNAKHGKVIVVVNRRTFYAFNTVDGSKAWEHLDSGGRGATSLHLAPMPLVADDIVFGATGDYTNAAAVLDVKTGKLLDVGGWLPFKRGCSRVIGNDSLLTYRNAATEVFDYASKTRINFNSVRAGCTANFLPADGVLNAPSFGHGCVCNYPTFASLAMVHLPELDSFKPQIVRDSERERSVITPLAAPARPVDAKPLDVTPFRLVGGTLKPAPGGCVFSTTDAKEGFAVREARQPLRKGEFAFTFKKATPRTVSGRHGNCFFVLGTSGATEDLIQVMLYYGGRRSIVIFGKHVEDVDTKFEYPRQPQLSATVAFDLATRQLSVTIDGKTVRTKITADIPAITHYGFGGSNSDTFFSALATP